MSARTITAAAPVSLLLRSLATAQWGYLDGAQWQGVRSTLRAIGDLIHDRYAQGTVTAWDVKRGAGLSERWVRECLHWLEDAGLIEWQRGGVWQGHPQPGLIRVVRSALVDLIRLARPVKDQATRDRNERTRARLARLGVPTIKKQRPRLRRSDHAELSTDLTHSTSEGSPTGLPFHPHTTTRGQDMHRAPFDPKYLPVSCTHGVGDPSRCQRCRYIAKTLTDEAQATSRRTAPKYHTHQVTEPPRPQDDALPLTAFDQYMDEHYPNLDHFERARAALKDPRAKELARG